MIRFPVHLGQDAMDRFLDHCAERGYRSFLVVTDENTWEVLGRRVIELLETADADYKTVVLSGEEVVADAHYLTEVMVASDPSERVFLAVGSGTITDITRLVSHRTGAVFVSLPTAPSVDGFASIGAPVVLRGIKQTVLAHPPEALFGDLSVLAAAPASMIAAGFGDLLGKITSVADWRLGALLYDEPYDDDIAERSLAAALRCANRAEEIGARSPAAIRLLMEGLIESGLCMLDFGESRPASGAEHHASHFWEMKLLREGRIGILHGAKVGIATGMVAERYEILRGIDRDEASRRLARYEPPSRDAEIATIREVFGPIADSLIAAQERFLSLAAGDPGEGASTALTALTARILENWDRVQEIAARVPPPEQIRAWLTAAGGPTGAAEVGLSEEERDAAFTYSHYLRDRFTIRKLERFLGLLE